MTDFTSYFHRPQGPSNQQLILMGLQHMQAGRMREAEQCYRTVQQRDPNPTTSFLIATMLPPIYQSRDDLFAWRKRFTDGVRDLKKRNVTLDLSKHLAVPTFTTAYQGMDDLELHRELTSLYIAPPAPPIEKKKPDGKIKVGFISTYFRDHTIGKLNHGLVEKLSREKFHVSVLSVGNHSGDLSNIYRKHADQYYALPQDPNVAAERIRSLNLDILFYTDLGMEPLTYTLAFSRLAPVQCVTWGHPDTTAIRAIDYFISSEDLDTADAQRLYTEKLVRPKLPTVYYHRPEIPANLKTRADFGFTAESTLYGCPQTLYKFHPEFDHIIGGILRGDDDGLLVLIKGQSQTMDDLLMARFKRTITDVADRIRFVPRQDRHGFLSLNSILDVSLDPLHFGGGNTSYEAFALGLPIVTLPSEFLRGRITYAQYRMMGIDDCIVQYPGEYIQKALKLGKDADYRASVKKKILERNSVLYENEQAVRGLESFFESAVVGNLCSHAIYLPGRGVPQKNQQEPDGVKHGTTRVGHQK
jgi:predicted O-linked N-acetylglucosamine transferase (SPINDLY family)